MDSPGAYDEAASAASQHAGAQPDSALTSTTQARKARANSPTSTRTNFFAFVIALVLLAVSSIDIENSMLKLGVDFSSISKKGQGLTSYWALRASDVLRGSTPQPTDQPSLSPTLSPTIPLPSRGEIVKYINSTVNCIPNSCPDNMCPRGVPRIPSVTIQDGGRTMNKQSTFYSKNWGNVLSPYWAARAMAEIGGYQYKGGMFGRGSWMEFLPTHAMPRVPIPNLFQQICNRCKHYEFFHRGECSEAWSHIAPAIMNDTQHAIMEHSKREPENINDLIFKFFRPDDWLIYNRCCVFAHGQLAPGIIKTFDAIPSRGSFNVYIMMGRDEDPYRFCKPIVDESIEYMKKRNPAINITILDRSTPYVDFGRLVFAPNVLVAGMGSSWALFSAVLANSNNVVAHANMWSNATMLPRNVKFLLDVPTLIAPKRFEPAAEAYGIEIEQFKFSNSSEDREKVFNYFRGINVTKVLLFLET